MSQKTIAILFLLCWSLISLYLGIGGTLVTENYNQIDKDYDFASTEPAREFRNVAEMLLAIENEKSAIIFPFLPILPAFVATILTACFFGMLGGVISVLKQVAVNKKPITETSYVSIPLLGFFTGMVILGINYIIPAIFVSGENAVRPMTLLFLALFAGMHAEEFYTFISSTVKVKIFKKVVTADETTTTTTVTPTDTQTPNDPQNEA